MHFILKILDLYHQVKEGRCQLRPILITDAVVYTEQEIIEKGSILIENGKISGVFTAEDKELPRDAEVINGSGLYAIPGFIDGHIHGARGKDVMDATRTSLQGIAAALPREGTTSFLATTMTGPRERIEKALVNIKEYQHQAGIAELLGVHLEGPFLEKKRAGAQPAEYMIQPDDDLFQKWQRLSGNKIKIVTMAPEHDQEGKFIKKLTKSGVNVFAGHTDVGFEGMKRAVEHGVSSLTHLCNAMSGIHHSDIGAVGAAFLLKELRAELIADGIHVSPQMLQLIVNEMGSERLMLITDSMRAKGLGAGHYELGGQQVQVTKERAALADGTLAGSILNMNEGVRRMLELDGVTLRDVMMMASVNPAKQIGVFDRKGSIAVGKDADLLLVDGEINIHMTLCMGVVTE